MQALLRGGAPLAHSLRAFFGPRLGQDLGRAGLEVCLLSWPETTPPTLAAAALADLDREPGWVPWLRREVRFAFRDDLVSWGVST